MSPQEIRFVADEKRKLHWPENTLPIDIEYLTLQRNIDVIKFCQFNPFLSVRLISG
jgi:hypothetical protein